MFAKIEVVTCAVVWSIMIGFLSFLFPLWPLMAGLVDVGWIHIDQSTAFLMAAILATMLAAYVGVANVRHGALEGNFKYAFRK